MGKKKQVSRVTTTQCTETKRIQIKTHPLPQEVEQAKEGRLLKEGTTNGPATEGRGDANCPASQEGKGTRDHKEDAAFRCIQGSQKGTKGCLVSGSKSKEGQGSSREYRQPNEESSQRKEIGVQRKYIMVVIK